MSIFFILLYVFGLLFFHLFAYLESGSEEEYRRAFALSFIWPIVIIMNVINKLLK